MLSPCEVCGSGQLPTNCNVCSLCVTEAKFLQPQEVATLRTELQRVRGQRDRLAEEVRPIVGYLADNRGRDGIEAALADVAAHP